MESDLRRRWIEAATVLATDPTAVVRCPQCEDEYLEVTDIPYENFPGMFSRHLRCPKCGAYEILDRLRRPTNP